jgi:hypothetical protein
MGTVTRLDPEIAASLTAEATLRIATPTSREEAPPAVEDERPIELGSPIEQRDGHIVMAERVGE